MQHCKPSFGQLCDCIPRAIQSHIIARFRSKVEECASTQACPFKVLSHPRGPSTSFSTQSDGGANKFELAVPISLFFYDMAVDFLSSEQMLIIDCSRNILPWIDKI